VARGDRHLVPILRVDDVHARQTDNNEVDLRCAATGPTAVGNQVVPVRNQWSKRLHSASLALACRHEVLGALAGCEGFRLVRARERQLPLGFELCRSAGCHA
jgi:hypothetical protein